MENEEWLDAVEEASLALGLPPPRGDEINIGESDHAMILMQLKKNAKRLLRKGWWFNRREGQTLERNASREITLAPNVLHVTPVRLDNYMPAPHIQIRPISGNPALGFQLFDVDESTFKFKSELIADVIVEVPPELIPVEAMTFLAYQTANKLSQVFGVQPSAEAQQAFADLLKSEAEFSYTHNAISNNPSIARTVTRTP